jgi:hypothetical protein
MENHKTAEEREKSEENPGRISNVKRGKNISVRGLFFSYFKTPILPTAALKERKPRYRNHAVPKCVRNWHKKTVLQLLDEDCING